MTVRRLAALMGRVARRVVRLMVVLACVRVSVAVVGEWVTAAGLSAVILVRGLASWVVLEQRLDGARHPKVGRYSTAPRGARVVGHVAFARALVAVSERYLDLCEDQADEHGQTRGEGWR
jgi:hypothetical protein